MPDLVRLPGQEVEAFQVRTILCNGPDACGSLDLLCELLWQIELEKPVLITKRVNRVELVTDNPQTLGKVHSGRVTKYTLTN